MTPWTNQRETVFLDRYAAKDKAGAPIETKPEQMWDRVAEAIANDEKEKAAFRSILDNFKFVPGGRILAAAGTGTEQTFYNCYVIPVEARRSFGEQYPGNDSRESIFHTCAKMVDIMSRGGGVGINWSVLRPASSYLTRVSGTSSGPVGWMGVASAAVGEVIQGGSRRGAAMFMLDDWHPDIEAFIDGKRNLDKITNANVSVAVSDRFMEAVQDGSDWNLEFPETSHPAYDLEWDGNLRGWKQKGYPTRIHRKVNARELWRHIAESAHHNGEPGVVFLDRYNKLSTGSAIEQIISVNPCGEQGLGAYSVCNLGSMNLERYVTLFGQDGSPVFDLGAFKQDIAVAVRFLDNVIDKTHYWNRETENVQKKLRRIGLGVMGLADALIKLGFVYGEVEAVRFTERVFCVMKDVAIETSIALAQEKGTAHGWDKMMWTKPFLAEYLSRHPERLGVSDGLRNLFLLTQAPTGTTSILAGVNSGIEPYFDFGYTRKDRTGTHYVKADILAEFKRDNPDYPEDGLPAEFITANDVTVEGHIAMQAGAQRYIDSSVSKTINAPNSHTVEDVVKAFTLAYEAGCKGVAYFRDGCGRTQVLTRDNPQENEVIKGLEAKVAELSAKLAFKSRTESSVKPPILAPIAMGVTNAGQCPVCGAPTVHAEGCETCPSCAWSKC